MAVNCLVAEADAIKTARVLTVHTLRSMNCLDTVGHAEAVEYGGKQRSARPYLLGRAGARPIHVAEDAVGVALGRVMVPNKAALLAEEESEAWVQGVGVVAVGVAKVSARSRVHMLVDQVSADRHLQRVWGQTAEAVAVREPEGKSERVKAE